MKRDCPATRGAVTLVALCFVVVIGMILGGYLAICLRAMNLSNRAFQAGLARQLAELGLEEGLRAFNANAWDSWTNGISAEWTLDPANHRARCELTFPAEKFGQGVTAKVRVRLDNYDAFTGGVTWNSGITYGRDEVVGHDGIWYRAVQGGNLGHTPSTTPGNLGWWAYDPVPWAWRSDATYVEDSSLVFRDGSWWRCTDTHVSGEVFAASKWAPTAPPAFSFQPARFYWENQFVYRTSDDTWYRSKLNQWAFTFNAAHWEAVSGSASGSPSLAWAYRDTIPYSFNDLVYHRGAWHRYINPDPGTGITPGSNPTYWENALSGSTHGWIAGKRYRPGDAVFHGETARWYRCLRAHTSSAALNPTLATYWSDTPAFSPEWTPTRRYNLNHTALHHGVWYRSLRNGNVERNPTASPDWWIGADTADADQRWQPEAAYLPGDWRAYGGVWYRALAASTGIAPNHSSYWTASSPSALGLTTGAPVLYAQATLTLPGQPPLRVQLRGTLLRAPLVPNAIAARTHVSIGAGAGTIDSYDSSLGTGYAAQVYNPATNYSAVVAAAATLQLSGNTTVRGYLAWPAPPANVSTTATVAGPSSPVAPRIDPARLSRSPVVPTFEILPAGGLARAFDNADFPAGTALGNPTGLGSILNLGTPGAVVPSVYHYPGNFELWHDDDHYTTVHINGPVILYLDGNLRLRGGGGLRINSTGSAEIHFAGHLSTDFKHESIINRAPSADDPDPRNLVLLADTSSTGPQHYNSVLPLHGIFYFPETNAPSGLTFSAGAPLFGAVSARQVSFTSAPQFHYDVSLRHAAIGGVAQPFTLGEWRELPASESAIMP